MSHAFYLVLGEKVLKKKPEASVVKPAKHPEHYKHLLSNTTPSDGHPLHYRSEAQGAQSRHISHEPQMASVQQGRFGNVEQRDVAPSVRFIQTRSGHLIKSPSIDMTRTEPLCFPDETSRQETGDAELAKVLEVSAPQ